MLELGRCGGATAAALHDLALAEEAYRQAVTFAAPEEQSTWALHRLYVSLLKDGDLRALAEYEGMMLPALTAEDALIASAFEAEAYYRSGRLPEALTAGRALLEAFESHAVFEFLANFEGRIALLLARLAEKSGAPELAGRLASWAASKWLPHALRSTAVLFHTLLRPPAANSLSLIEIIGAELPDPEAPPLPSE